MCLSKFYEIKSHLSTQNIGKSDKSAHHICATTFCLKICRIFLSLQLPFAKPEIYSDNRKGEIKCVC